MILFRKKSSSLLKKRLEEILGVTVVTPEYMDVYGRFLKLRTRKSIEEYADRVEHILNETRENNPDEPIVALGHSMGGIILRLLFKRGQVFQQMIFAGTPNKGFSSKFLYLKPLAKALGIKPFFEMAPGSEFLGNLGDLPDGIYIGGKEDGVVPVLSAAPLEVSRRIEISCGHSMFPREDEGNSAIPIVAEIIEKLMSKAL